MSPQRAELRKRPFHFDSIGLSLLVIVMVCWEVMLSKGQEWDWLGDPFWRVQTLGHSLRGGSGRVDLLGVASPQPRGQFPAVAANAISPPAASSSSALMLVLYGASTSLPGLLQSLFGYDALQRRAGDVACRDLSPSWRCRSSAACSAGRTDARWLIAAGLLIMTAGNYWMSQLNLDISPGQVIWPRVRRGRGTVDMFCARERRGLPLYAAGVARGRRRLVESAAQRGGQRRDVVGPDLAGAARSIPHACGSGSISIPSTRPCSSFLEQAQAFFLQQTGDPVAAQQLALQATRKSASAAGIVAGLFRLLLDVGRVDVCARVRGSVDEAFGGREGRSPCR